MISEMRWERIVDHKSPLRPSPRHSHSMCSDPKRSSIFLIGGISSDDSTLCNDAFWQYNYHSNSWSNWSNCFDSSSRRVGHAALIHGDTLLIVGGHGNQRDCGLETFVTSINLATREKLEYELVTHTYI
jgi:hypothetical protein